MSEATQRYFFAKDLNEQSKKVSISGDEFHHMVHVNRLREGNICKLLNGKGVVATGSVTELHKNFLTIDITEVECIEKDNRGVITLLQGVSRKGAFGVIVEKAVELGVNKVIPLLSEFSNVKALDSEKFQAKYNRIAQEAAKQSHCAWEMTVEAPCKFKMLHGMYQNITATKILLDPDEGIHPSQALRDLEFKNPSKPILLAVGPEGGFSQSEVKSFEATGFLKIKLPGHILKAETAAVAAVSLVRFGQD